MLSNIERPVLFFKVCFKHNDHEKTVDKREVVASSSQPDVHTLLLAQLQDKLSNIQSQYQVADNNLQHEITSQAAELRQEVKSESAKLQQQLGDVREQVSTELAAVDVAYVFNRSTIRCLNTTKSLLVGSKLVNMAHFANNLNTYPTHLPRLQ